MQKPVTIYALIDPRDPFRVRYVGKTTNGITQRLGQHLCGRFRHKSHKNDWIKALLSDSQKPVAIAIQECTVEQWEKWERFWIDHFKSFGLVNSTEGGDTVCNQTGYRHTPEAIEKIRQASLGRKFPNRPSPMKGRHWSEETRLKMMGLQMSDATRSKISAAKTGKPFPALGLQRAIAANTGRKRSPETCAKIGARHRGKVVPEHVRRLFMKPVKCLETGQLFESLKSAAEANSVARTSIGNALSGRTKTAGGFHWERI